MQYLSSNVIGLWRFFVIKHPLKDENELKSLNNNLFLHRIFFRRIKRYGPGFTLVHCAWKVVWVEAFRIAMLRCISNITQIQYLIKYIIKYYMNIMSQNYIVRFIQCGITIRQKEFRCGGYPESFKSTLYDDKV